MNNDIPNFNIVKRGYDIQEVDEYISGLEEELRKYREKETAINNAILNAQVAADGIINYAKKQADEIAGTSEQNENGLPEAWKSKKTKI